MNLRRILILLLCCCLPFKATATMLESCKHMQIVQHSSHNHAASHCEGNQEQVKQHAHCDNCKAQSLNSCLLLAPTDFVNLVFDKTFLIFATQQPASVVPEQPHRPPQSVA